MVLLPTFSATKIANHYIAKPRIYSTYDNNVYVLIVQKHTHLLSLSRSPRSTRFIGFELSKSLINVVRKGTNIFEINQNDY